MNRMYDSTNNRAADGHDIVMQGRKTMEITGVKQVESFDSEEFLLLTVMGMLIIKGENLQMKNLDVDRGLVEIKGRVLSLVYTDQSANEKSKGLFSKLFK
ncbi:sporulation protein YabP [Bacillus sp. B190/17]|uniref:Sporulation protein YabP n=1 Tax=Bacillus lumedeiriae TaxID=3058829 RepID=A0ABW8ICR4_9BACI